MILVGIIWFVLAFVIGVAAERRGRSGFGWFLVALLLSPLIAGILLAVFPDKHLRALLEEPRRSSAVDDQALLRNIEGAGPGSIKRSLPTIMIGALLLFGILWIGWSKQIILRTTQPETNKNNEVLKQVAHTPPPHQADKKPDTQPARVAPAPPATATPAVTPAAIPQSRPAESVIVALDGGRDGDRLIVTGKTQGLPSGTKLWVEITRLPGHAPSAGGPMDDHVFVAADGTFKATMSKPDRVSFAPGTYDIKITSIFNSGWQSVDVLRRAGVQLDTRGRSDLLTNPTAIPESPDFKPDDPEFPKATRHLEAIQKITVGALTSDVAAIDGVKDAILVVQGRGRSSLSVGKSVDFFVSAGGFNVVGWSAAIGSDGKWVVTLDCIDGANPKKAKWQYDPGTKAVKYLDPLSKLLSYVPPD